MREDSKSDSSNSKDGLFAINSNNQEFAQRQKNVFDQLNTITCNLTNSEQGDDSEHLDVVDRTQRKITKQFRNRESIFKRPHVPVRTQSKKIPDHCLNPHKWTKYSLEDVRNEDMSERGNTSAAMSFLKELADRKEKTETSEEPETSKIVFRKNLINSSNIRTSKYDPDEIIFRNSKVIMPEYVVGQKIKKTKKKKESEVRSSSTQLKLDHLLTGDEEDE